MKKLKAFFFPIFALMIGAILMSNTDCQQIDAVSNSGVKKMDVTVTTNLEGNTVEQANYAERLRRDNLPGSIKHLYVISPATGDVLLYSTVKGKVTSSGKRLTPSTVEDYGTNYNLVILNGRQLITKEVMGDDGMYGTSIPYIYWYDSKDVYHQHYIGGNEMLHISDQPLSVKNVVLNLEIL